jgi:hypothetical protein
MKLGVRLTAVGAALLSAVAAGASAPSANAVPVIIGARVCITADDWHFAPRLGITPFLGGGVTANYSADCYVQAGVTTAPPFLVTSARATYTGTQHYTYNGDCVLAVLTGGTATVGAGILIGGIVSVTAGSDLGTFNNVAVKVLVPDAATGSDICSEQDANGLGVTVGTVNNV